MYPWLAKMCVRNVVPLACEDAESWDQIAQDRTKWRGLIRRGAGEYEAKRISEAKQKRAQWKAKAKASSTELSSDLSYSILS